MYLVNTPQNSKGHQKQKSEKLSQSSRGKEMMTKFNSGTEKKNYVKIGSMNKLQTLISVLIVVH